MDIKAMQRLFVSGTTADNTLAGSIGAEEQADKPEFTITPVSGFKNYNIPFKTDHFTLLLVLEGNRHIATAQHEFELLPQSISLLSENQIFTIKEADSDFKAIILSFKKEFLSKSYLKDTIVNELLIVNPAYPPVYQLMDTEQYSRVLRECEEIEKEYARQSPFFYNIIRLRLVELLYEYNRACEYCLYHFNKKMNRQFQITYQFKLLVNEFFLTKRTVSEYAALIFISAKHLGEMVKAELDIAALDLIHNRILLEAQYLLRHSGSSIKEISEQLSFDTAAHFARFFKAKTGLKPLAYRRIP